MFKDKGDLLAVYDDAPGGGSGGKGKGKGGGGGGGSGGGKGGGAGTGGEDSDLTRLTTGADSYGYPRAFSPH